MQISLCLISSYKYRDVNTIIKCRMLENNDKIITARLYEPSGIRCKPKLNTKIFVLHGEGWFAESSAVAFYSNDIEAIKFTSNNTNILKTISEAFKSNLDSMQSTIESLQSISSICLALDSSNLLQSTKDLIKIQKTTIDSKIILLTTEKQNLDSIKTTFDSTFF